MPPEPGFLPAGGLGETSCRRDVLIGSHTLTISLFDTAFPKGPALGSAKTMTWADFADQLRQRREGQKDGPNFVPATFQTEPGGGVRRLSKNLLTRTAIVLDCETNKLTGEIPPSFAEAVELVEREGWAGAVYTSHSHERAAPRYRIVLPLSEQIAFDLPAVDIIADLLQMAGVIDRTKIGAASLFYLPSCPPGQTGLHDIEILLGLPIAADWISEEAGALKSRRDGELERKREVARAAAIKRREERAQQFGDDANESIIDKIRHRLDLEDELVAHDYTKIGDRYLYPKSRTGVPGVHILNGDSIDRVYSHHSDDPLAADNLPSWATVKAVDVVDVVTILDFGGDRTKALRKLAERFGFNQKPKQTPHGEARQRSAEAQPQGQVEDDTEQAESAAAFAQHLSAEAWAARQFKPSVRLLGDLVTTTSRTFIVGQTGLGKTMLGMACAAGMATGAGFLEWRCDRPARVLYVDGEMPGELVRIRVRDAMRRLGRTDLAGNLFVYCADTSEEMAKLVPGLGTIEPLNTEAGQNFVYSLIKRLGGVDVVIFDNVMSLVAGDQKDEVPWSETMPLIAGLTSRQIGQIWLDHTGHNTARQYGSSTKAWRFDAVGIMTDLPEDQRNDRETGFKLSFDAPGKARRRTPDNWAEFAPRIVRLRDDQWISEGEGSTGPGLGKVSPSRAIFHSALLGATTASCAGAGRATLEEWEAECVRRGLIEAPDPDEDNKAKATRRARFRSAKVELAGAKWIGISDQTVSDLTRKYL